MKKRASTKAKTTKRAVEQLVDVGAECIERWSNAFAPPAWRVSILEPTDVRFWHDMNDHTGRDFGWWGFLAWCADAAASIDRASDELRFRIAPQIAERFEGPLGPIVSQALAQDLARGFVGEAFGKGRVVAQSRALDCWGAGLVLGTWSDDEGTWPVARYAENEDTDRPRSSFENRWRALGECKVAVGKIVADLNEALGHTPFPTHLLD